jgi:hypothetical protein
VLFFCILEKFIDCLNIKAKYKVLCHKINIKLNDIKTELFELQKHLDINDFIIVKGFEIGKKYILVIE